MSMPRRQGIDGSINKFIFQLQGRGAWFDAPHFPLRTMLSGFHCWSLRGTERTGLISEISNSQIQQTSNLLHHILMQHDNYKVRASVGWEALNKLSCSINIQRRLTPYAKTKTYDLCTILPSTFINHQIILTPKCFKIGLTMSNKSIVYLHPRFINKPTQSGSLFKKYFISFTYLF